MYFVSSNKLYIKCDRYSRRKLLDIRKNIKIYLRLGGLTTATIHNVFRIHIHFYHVVGTNIDPATASGNNPEKLKYFLYLDFWKLTKLAILAYDIKIKKCWANQDG